MCVEIKAFSLNCDLSMNPEKENKQSDRGGKPEPNLQIRRKSTTIPDFRSCCHRTYSGHKAGGTMEI
jgi:hypothetical protein